MYKNEFQFVDCLMFRYSGLSAKPLTIPMGLIKKVEFMERCHISDSTKA